MARKQLTEKEQAKVDALEKKYNKLSDKLEKVYMDKVIPLKKKMNEIRMKIDEIEL